MTGVTISLFLLLLVGIPAGLPESLLSFQPLYSGSRFLRPRQPVKRHQTSNPKDLDIFSLDLGSMVASPPSVSGLGEASFDTDVAPLHVYEFLAQILAVELNLMTPSPSLQAESNIRKLRRAEPQSFGTCASLANGLGYPFETHTVTTKDGYYLTIHRIPAGRHQKASTSNRPPVILAHGLVMSSFSWIANDRKNSLGFLLADSGYDVWMLNFRGNSYSRRHRSLTPKDSRFWATSYDDMAEYDMPVIIDYVLRNTDKPTVSVVAHSMGSSVILGLLATKPQYNKKVRLVVTMAPAPYVRNMRSTMRWTMSYWPLLTAATQSMGVAEVLAWSERQAVLLRAFCNNLSNTMCKVLYNWVGGINLAQLNVTRLPVYFHHFPAGTNMQILTHFVQSRETNKFARFDRGAQENLKKYGQESPPVYNLTRVSVPVAVFYSDGDLLVGSEDCIHVASQIPNLVASLKMPDKNWSHLDYVLGKSAGPVLYMPIVELLRRYHLT